MMALSRTVTSMRAMRSQTRATPPLAPHRGASSPTPVSASCFTALGVECARAKPSPRVDECRTARLTPRRNNRAMTTAYYDAARTARVTKELLVTMDLERVSERMVRDAVRAKLCANDDAHGDAGDSNHDDGGARATRDVDPNVIKRTIDEFLTHGTVGDPYEAPWRDAADARANAIKGERAPDTYALSPPLVKRMKLEGDREDASVTVPYVSSSPVVASAVVVGGDADRMRVLNATRALGADGGSAKDIAKFTKLDKSGVNKILYALASSGVVVQVGGDGGAPVWVAREEMGARAMSSGATTMPAMPAMSQSHSQSYVEHAASGTVPPAAARVVSMPSSSPSRTVASTSAGTTAEAVEGQVAELSTTKRLVVRKFKSATLVDIREYYQKTKGEGPWLPGKKGISLNASQWQALSKAMGSIPDAMAEAERSKNEVTVCDLGGNRKCTASVYKGMVLLNVREYYEKNGVLCPGAKGVALSKDAAMKFLESVERVDAAVEALG